MQGCVSLYFWDGLMVMQDFVHGPVAHFSINHITKVTGYLVHHAVPI
jgi:hypothetical protein